VPELLSSFDAVALLTLFKTQCPQTTSTFSESHFSDPSKDQMDIVSYEINIFDTSIN
jgi:hypothetical protein